MAPILRDIHFWPRTGFSGVKWMGHYPESGDARDALLRGSRAVSELFSSALAAEGLVSPSASLRVFTADALAAGEDLEVTLHEDGATVSVPAGFESVPRRRRDEIVTELWREILQGDVAAAMARDDALEVLAVIRARRESPPHPAVDDSPLADGRAES